MRENYEWLESDYDIVDEPARRKRPAKYIAGPVIHGFAELLAAIDAGQRIWIHNRSFHASWVANKAMQPLRRQADSGGVRRAVINPLYVHWLERELDAAKKELFDV